MIGINICVCSDSLAPFHCYKSFTAYTCSVFNFRARVFSSIPIESTPFWKYVVGWMLFSCRLFLFFLVVLFINGFFSIPFRTHILQIGLHSWFYHFLFIHIITYCGFNSHFNILFIFEDVGNTVLKGLTIGEFSGHSILCYLFLILSNSYMIFIGY